MVRNINHTVHIVHFTKLFFFFDSLSTRLYHCVLSLEFKCSRTQTDLFFGISKSVWIRFLPR